MKVKKLKIKNKIPYTIGVDIGTGSVGAVAINNETLQPLTFRGRPALLAHTFEQADTAEATRLSRGASRGYDRRIKRIQMVQKLFAPYINNSGFFSLEDNGHFWNNSNNFLNKTLSEILRECGYSKKEIAEQFPTIYHLRKHLIDSNEKMDLRLVYLAVHNLTKYRGHFLNEGLQFEGNDSSGDELIITLLNDYIRLNELPPVDQFTNKFVEEIDTHLKNTKKTRTDRANAIRDVLLTEINQISKTNANNLGKLLVGSSVGLNTIFFSKEDEVGKGKIAVSNDFEELVLDTLDEDQIAFIENVQKLYLSMIFEEIMAGEKTVAHAKVKHFKEFKEELLELKDFIYKAHGKEEYQKYFVTKPNIMREYDDTHSPTVFKNLSYFDKYRLARKLTTNDSELYKELKKLLKKELANEKLDERRVKLQKRVDNEELLRFLNTTDNSAIPYQNSVYEIKEILSKQSKHYDFIDDTFIENIITIVSFRIPYYIGPLVKNIKDNPEQSKFGWSTRKIDTNITPLNFDEVIDKSDSAREFIERMTNTCTYLTDKKVLPKHSLLYQEMEVLNELNGIQIRHVEEAPKRGFRLAVEERDNVIEHLFKNQKKVSHKALMNYFKKSEAGYTDQTIYGTQKESEFASSLSTYVDFKRIIGKEKLENHMREIDLIVFWITIYNEKDIIEDNLNQYFHESNDEGFLTDNEIADILKLNYSGWGRISKEALTMEGYEDESIISLMRKHTMNFMEALTDSQYAINETFEQYNKQGMDSYEITDEEIDNLQCSPALKRGIRATIKIINEYVEIFGEPTNIVLEFAREEGEKKRTVDRKKAWETLTRSEKLEKDPDFKHLFDELKDNPQVLDDINEKIYLYLHQGAKCMYSLEHIHLIDLIRNPKDYQVDHILPRSFVKDDSLDNKVLVTTKANQDKKGTLMPRQIYQNLNYKKIEWWNLLLDKNMITKSKFFKLMKEEFTESDKEGFIARQLVETRQISVHVRNLLEKQFNYDEKDRVKISTLKAGIISEVRRGVDIPKIRQLNDHHHAIDALLIAGTYTFANIIKPGFFDFNFKRSYAKKKWDSIETDQTKKEFNSELFLISKMRKNKIFNDKTFKEVMEEVVVNYEPLVTRKTGNTLFEFYKQTMISPKTKKNGGTKIFDGKPYMHTNLYNAFAILIKFDYKKKDKIITEKTILDIPVIDENAILNNNVNRIIELIEEQTKIVNVIPESILVDTRIDKGDLIIFENEKYYFKSSNELTKFKQFKLDLDLQKKLRKSLYTNTSMNFSELLDIYNRVIDEFITQYRFIMPQNTQKFLEREKEMRAAFSSCKQSHGEYLEYIEDILKIASPSAQRSLKFNNMGRKKPTKSALIKEAKIAYESITGLYHKKPKYLHKFLE